MSTQRKQNVWNQLLFEKSRTQKYVNKNVIMFGRKGAGKRILIDSLTEISRTTYPKSNYLAGKLRIKGTTPLLDYTYLNVVDLRDPDYMTNARLNISILEEEQHKQLLQTILDAKSIKNSLFVICLDLQEPWTLMEDLDKWVSVLQDLRGDLKLNLSQLEEMQKEIECYVRSFNEQAEEMDADNITQLKPLREGVLQNNVGVPLMVVVNKSDILEKEDKGKDWDTKAEVIQYYLRTFCVNYGATLLFTSAKQKVNLEIFYNYILHRLYEMPLIDKSDRNFESLYYPIGIDDYSIIKSEFSKYVTNNVKFEDEIPINLKKNTQKEELVVEDDQEYFAKLKEKTQTQQSTKPSFPLNIPRAQEQVPQAPQADPTTTNGPSSARANQQLVDFYSKLLNQPKLDVDKTLAQNAQTQLHEKLRQTTKAETIGPSTFKSQPFNDQEQLKLQKLLPNTSQQQQQQGSIRNSDIASKIKSITNQKQ